jgi:magnesium chelatase family protein
MATRKILERERQHGELLKRDHTLNGGVLVGLDGHFIEIQARAVEVLLAPRPITEAATITGMVTGAVREALQRIGGAYAKLGIPKSEVKILVNLAPADLPKYGTWLDLPLAVILLQAAGYLPDLPDHKEGDFVLMGEIGIHGEVRRIPGALSLAYRARPGQSLIVPAGKEKECALILAKPGHDGCGVFPVSTLEEVIRFFQGKGKIDNALREKFTFEPAIQSAVDFGRIKGQRGAREAAVISAAGGHNLLMVDPFTPLTLTSWQLAA